MSVLEKFDVLLLDDVNEVVAELGDAEGVVEVGELVEAAGVDAVVLVAAGVLPAVVDMLNGSDD